ncbi:DUF5392 family protein [Bacillus sp. FJAT-45350]|uniref:DUF5392 family protein n=1 Tax=Bacillus sp. FJAT-45350 TaxID=2011014 RepID=UPI000BB7E048|nr:DUF5392 family protein [Bacillus sp. FJAT-45350]
MMPIKLDGLSTYIRKEIEKIQSTIAPLMKKSMLLTFVSISMLSVAIVNLFILIFGSVNSQTVMIVAFSLLGAIGMALYKETVHQNKEIQKKSIEYIKERIKGSKSVPEETKDQYIEKVTREPMIALQTFCEFLSKEERIKRMEDFSA